MLHNSNSKTFKEKFSQRNNDGIVIAIQGCQRIEKGGQLVLDLHFRLGMADKHKTTQTKQLISWQEMKPSDRLNCSAV